jgi:glycosyltransferase involved in cell wall biosynthesis
MSSTPQVTVVVPTRDRVELLEDTVRSILSQRAIDLAVVVVDDGSQEVAATAIRRLSSSRLTVLRNPTSRGVASARNQGADHATSRWVAFCDDDDLWTPDKVLGQVDAAERAGSRWAYTGAVKFAVGPVVWQVMPPPKPEVLRTQLADRNLIPAGASNVLVERTTFQAVGGFDEELAHLADWDLWLRLLELGQPASAHGLGVAYRLHPGAMSLNPSGILEELEILDQRWRHLREGRALDPAPTHLWIAMSWLRAGRRLPALTAYLRAVRSRPRQALRGVLRTLHPAPPSPAHVTSPEHRRSRFKRVEHVALPPAMSWLLDEFAPGPPSVVSK